MEKKKTIKVVGIIGGIIILLALAFSVGGNSSSQTSTTELSNDPEVVLANAQSESSKVKDSEKKDFTQIDVAKYLEYYADSEPHLVLLARPTCTYCQIATPIIQNIMYENNLEINYLNTDEFTEETQTEFIQSDEFFKSGYGTPILLIVKDNSIVDKVDGMTDRAHYIEFFKTNGYIK